MRSSDLVRRGQRRELQRDMEKDMTDTIKTADLLRLHDALRDSLGLRLFHVHLWPNSRAHIYAESARDARQRVLEMNPNARITGITDTMETL